MSRAVRAMTGYAFTSLRLHRIEAACLPHNAGIDSTSRTCRLQAGRAGTRLSAHQRALARPSPLCAPRNRPAALASAAARPWLSGEKCRWLHACGIWCADTRPCSYLRFCCWRSRRLAAIESVRIPLDATAIDLTKAVERYGAQGDRLLVSTAPRLRRHCPAHRGPRARTGLASQLDRFLALTNDTDEQLERLVVCATFPARRLGRDLA